MPYRKRVVKVWGGVGTKWSGAKGRKKGTSVTLSTIRLKKSQQKKNKVLLVNPVKLIKTKKNEKKRNYTFQRLENIRIWVMVKIYQENFINCY